MNLPTEVMYRKNELLKAFDGSVLEISMAHRSWLFCRRVWDSHMSRCGFVLVPALLSSLSR